MNIENDDADFVAGLIAADQVGEAEHDAAVPHFV